VQDGLLLADEIRGFDVPIRIVPDASLACLMSTGKVTKVFLGAHSVAELPDGAITFTNTTGTLMIVKLAALYDITTFVLAEESKLSTGSLDIDGLDSGGIVVEEKNPLLRDLMKARNITHVNPGWDVVSSSDARFTLVTENRVVGNDKKNRAAGLGIG
jgi:methylthioribose-1-phosphate isomerase